MSARIAVLLPCHNEAVTIGDVVKGFKAALPDSTVYVYDNNSTDRTADIARAAGAVVHREPQQGKGYVVRRMFSDVEADIYVLADGDGTYEPLDAPAMIARLRDDHLDMVVARRAASDPGAAWRAGHQFGNQLMTLCVARLFGERFADIFSGYRVFSRRMVKSFPALSTGFEIETALTVHALELDLPVAEIPSSYRGRPVGSSSKLNTYADGLHIALTVLVLYKDIKPFRFFCIIAAALAAVSIVLAEPLLFTYLETGLVPRFPTAILATGMMLLAFLSFACGLILDSVARGRREAKRMAYLALSPSAHG
jgi:glycosyltransferase involved in cell wall biosynthesis